MYGTETILKVHLFGEDFKLGSFKKTLGNKLTDKGNFSNYQKKKKKNQF